jgi:hypothetical protein
MATVQVTVQREEKSLSFFSFVISSCGRDKTINLSALMVV